MSQSSSDWLRSTQVRALIAAALTASLLLSGAILLVDRLHTTPSDVLDHPANPVSDDQSEAQAVESARQIVTLTGLRTASAGYTHGWTEGLPPNDHAFARSLTKDAVTAIVYLQSESPSQGVLRVYGQCRNMNNHRTDSTAWTDVTDRFKAP
jgi:hypothetical protein